MRKFLSSVGVTILIGIGLVQCVAQDVLVEDETTGEWVTLGERWTSQLFGPLEVQGHISKGYTHLQAGKLEEAFDEAAQAIELAPTHAEAYALRAAIYESRYRFDLALDDYEKAIELGSQESWVFTGLGWTRYGTNGDLHQVIADFTKALELDPDNVRAYFGRGTAYEDLNDFQNAIEDFTLAIHVDPDDAQNYRERGRAYTGLENFSAALDDYRKALELNPDDVDTHRELGYLHIAIGDYDQAFEDFSTALSYTPENMFEEGERFLDYHGLGLAYANLGNLESALQEFDRTIADYDEFAIAYRNRGFVHASLGNNELAINDLQKYLQLTPEAEDYEEVQDYLIQLQR